MFYQIQFYFGIKFSINFLLVLSSKLSKNDSVAFSDLCPSDSLINSIGAPNLFNICEGMPCRVGG